MKAILSFVFLAAVFLSATAQKFKPLDDKSEVKFTIKNFGLNTSGSFHGLKGSIVFNPSDPAACSFNVSIDVNTINTGIDARDSHLKKEDYFDATKFPTINFASTSITGSNNAYTVTGKLTIKGVTKTVSFPFSTQNQNGDLVLTGNFNIDRKDFGVGGSSAVLGNNVDVSLKVVAVKD
ncbi:MAG: YceI family protein [Parafilimonas sp.]|nr:YceI family protein [Parafilimonas sp.]